MQFARGFFSFELDHITVRKSDASIDKFLWFHFTSPVLVSHHYVRICGNYFIKLLSRRRCRRRHRHCPENAAQIKGERATEMSSVDWRTALSVYKFCVCEDKKYGARLSLCRAAGGSQNKGIIMEIYE